ncbi:MAG: hypothetical protein JXA21_12345 [Anaerolineae bacterium]|nr:hypothetical protein [Anaerolineae bacterium]
MSVNISDSITSNWPTTESNLLAAAEVVYATQKAQAIARAKVDLYGASPVPAEASIPDAAAYWIADQACLYLIPLAQDHYAIKRRQSDAVQGATVTYYDLVSELDGLERKLEQRVATNREAALLAIQAVGQHQAGETPVVSTAGLIVDPLINAYQRGGY